MSLSAVITTLNEEARIGACLAHLRFADEVVVVDFHSTDGTAERAREHGARVLQREQRSLSSQKNWAIAQAAGDWVLVVDADELVSGELASEIKRVVSDPNARDGYRVKRRNFFLGREIRHSGWQNDWVVRLFRKGRGTHPERHVHEQVVVDGPVGTLRGPLLHYSCRSLEDYWRKLRRYAYWNALEARRRGARVSPLYMMIHPPLRFLQIYLLQGGFLDGMPGLVVSLLTAVYVVAKDTRIWEQQTQAATGASLDTPQEASR